MADTYNHRVKRIDLGAGDEVRLASAGAGAPAGYADGPAQAARFSEPGGLSYAGASSSSPTRTTTGCGWWTWQTGTVGTLEIDLSRRAHEPPRSVPALTWGLGVRHPGEGSGTAPGAGIRARVDGDRDEHRLRGALAGDEDAPQDVGDFIRPGRLFAVRAIGRAGDPDSTLGAWSDYLWALLRRASYYCTTVRHSGTDGFRGK